MSDKLDIRPDHLAIVWQVLREHAPADAQFWVFGSRAKWTTKDFSDLDLAIDASRPLTKRELSTLQDAFEESDLPYKVDLVDLQTVSESFKAIIDEHKLPLPVSRSGSGVMGWEERTIDDLKASSRNAIAMGPFGSRIKAENFVTKGIPVIKGGNLNGEFLNEDKFDFLTKEKADELRSANAYRRDIVITHRGTIGQVGIIPDDSKYERYVVSQSQLKVTLNQDVVNPYFVYYFLRSQIGQHRLLMNASQVGVPAIAKASTAVKAIEVPYPNKEVQDHIVEILLSLDDKIAINQQINQTLEAMAQAVFKSWFVDFEPTRAKMAALESGGTDEDATIAAMTAISGKSLDTLERLKTTDPEAYSQLHTTASLFPSSLVESELGEIPKGWNLSKIGNEIEAVGGGTPSTKETEFWEFGTIHWTTPKDMSDLKDKVLISTERKITEAGLRKISSGLLPVDTVLMSSRAPVGYLAIAKIPVAINQGYIAMKCNKQLTPEFVIQWCMHNMEEIKQRASGTTFAEISKKSFYPIPVVVPTAPILQSYTKSVHNFYSQVELLARENQNLAITRDSLLPKLLSGEISVENQLGSEG